MGLDLVNLHLLQYTNHGMSMMFGMIVVQSLVMLYAAWQPLNELSHITSHSTYTRISHPLLQACWIFVGQLLFGWFYLYSLSGSYSHIQHAEYLFWCGTQVSGIRPKRLQRWVLTFARYLGEL